MSEVTVEEWLGRKKKMNVRLVSNVLELSFDSTVLAHQQRRLARGELFLRVDFTQVPLPQQESFLLVIQRNIYYP